MIYERLTALAECLCSQITEDGSPPTCFCGVVPGDQRGVAAQVAGDCDVECGMAWVRLTTAYPASGVDLPNETVGNCSAGMGYEVEIGILRCISIGDSSGNLPTSAELLAATDLQIKDMLTMWRAVNCCTAFGSKDFRLGTYTPAGPSGGLVGGTWTLAMAE